MKGTSTFSKPPVFGSMLLVQGEDFYKIPKHFCADVQKSSFVSSSFFFTMVTSARTVHPSRTVLVDVFPWAVKVEEWKHDYEPFPFLNVSDNYLLHPITYYTAYFGCTTIESE